MIEGPRDHTLIDALEGLTTQAFEGRLWRVTRDGRDPTLFFAGGNRWDDGTFEVLYTSLSREGALAEMHYHVARGQPIAPSKIKYRLHELQVKIDGVLDLTNMSFLAGLGIDPATYGKLPYLDPSALLVPNARHDGDNMVIFGDYVSFEAIEHIEDHGVIDWSKV